MKLKLKITDSTSNLPWLHLYDFWFDHDRMFFPYSLGEQKQNARRIIKMYCNDKNKELEITSVFPAVLESVSECIKEKIINPEDIELTVYHEDDGQGNLSDTYRFTEEGDLEGDYKLINLINWLLH